MVPAIDRDCAFTLLRKTAAICEDHDATGANSQSSNRVFNIAYYFVYTMVCRGATSEMLLKEFDSRVRSASAESSSLEQGKRQVDAHVAHFWQSNTSV